MKKIVSGLSIALLTALGLMAGVGLAQTATRFALIRVDNLTSNRLVLGGGTSSLTPLAAGTTTTLLHGNAAGAPSYGAVSLTADVSGLLPLANLADGSALSVLGRSANTSGVQASIAAATDGNVMRRSGTAIGFGSLDLTAAGTVGSSVLPIANGGTNLAAAADDNVMVGNGTTWQTKALTSCSTASSAVTYNTSTNAWGCNTIASSALAITSGTFTVTYPICCSTTPTQNWAFTKTTDGVTASCTIYPTDIATGTGDSVNFSNTGGTQLPAAERPLQEVVFWGGAGGDAGANASTVIRFSTAGAVNIGKSAFDWGGAWTASGSREWPATNLSFPTFTYRCTP